MSDPRFPPECEALHQEATQWWDAIRPREEFAAHLRTKQWSRPVSDRRLIGRWFWGRSVAAILCALVVLAPFSFRPVRALLAPPYLPEVESQELVGDTGVAMRMSVTLQPGPKLFAMRFREEVTSRGRAEAAIAESCTACQFRFDWVSAKQLLIYLPSDPVTGGSYRVGLIEVTVPAHGTGLYEVDPAGQSWRSLGEITGLTPRSVSPDGRYVLLSRTDDGGEHPPALYLLDVESGARTSGSFTLPESPVAEVGPNGALLSWRRRDQAWDLIIQRPGASESIFALPETDDPPPTLEGNRVEYPLWRLCWSPDGQRLLAVYARLDQTGMVQLLDLTRRSIDPVSVGSFDQVVLWLPDSQQFAVVGQEETRVYGLDGHWVRTLPGRVRAWDPTRKQILFHDKVTDQAGTSLWTIPNGVTPVGWRPNGMLIVSREDDPNE